MENSGFVIGHVPAGTLVIRRADVGDMAAGPSRLVLFKEPDGTTYWLHFDGHKEQIKPPPQ